MELNNEIGFVENFCLQCGRIYETMYYIKDGMLGDIFCSDECGKKYYSIHERRKKKIDKIFERCKSKNKLKESF